MLRTGLIVMLTLMFALGNTWLAAAQEGGVIPADPGSNGKPAAAPAPAPEDTAAVAELERARALFEEDGKEREVARIALGLVDKFRAAKDNGHLVDSLFLAGDAYYFLGEWVDAERYMAEAYDIGTRFFPGQLSTYPLKVIGESQFEQDKYPEALETFQERVQLLRKADPEHELAGALFDEAGMLINLNREAEAVVLLTEALKINNEHAGVLSKAGSGATEAERAGNVVDHAEITYHLAIANFRLEKYEDARTLLVQAEGFFRSIHESKTYAVADRLVAVLDDLVLVNEQLGDTAAAEDYRAKRDELNK